ncbi:MAG: hypothetical protein ABJB09_03045 [Verrucomicrobiota bacterium]
MKRRLITPALFACAVLFLFGCTTVDTRIQERPEAYHRLSPGDQALVQQGKIREGMSQDVVYIAWGAPSQRLPGRNRGRIVETWVYDASAAGDYPGPFFYGQPYGFGIGFGGFYGGRRGRLHRGFFYDPFYDPFFYNHANIVRYPERIVSFENGRAISFQFLPPPRIY